MRKNNMTKDELKALREARATAMNESLTMLGLETETKRAQYAKACDVSSSALLVASVDENGFILTSTNAVRYKAQDTGEGTLFLDGGKDIYLRKDFLEAQGYNAEDGWPVALRVTMSFPTLLAEEPPVEKKPRKAGKRTRKAQELTHADVDNMAVKAGLGIGACHLALAAHDPDLVPVLPEAVMFGLEVWIAMHEDLRTSRRVRLVFDHLAAGMAAYAGRAGS